MGGRESSACVWLVQFDPMPRTHPRSLRRGIGDQGQHGAVGIGKPGVTQGIGAGGGRWGGSGQWHLESVVGCRRVRTRG